MTRPGAVRTRTLLPVGGALAVALALLAVPQGLAEALTYLLPALLLLLALLRRSYPGEQALLGFLRRRRARPNRMPAAAAAGRPRPRAVMPRGGLLLARSLAVRPPPASLVTGR